MSYYNFIVDGHHKLIRWKIVTHGAIDGIVVLLYSCKRQTTIVPAPFMDIFLMLYVRMDCHLVSVPIKDVRI